MRWSGSRPGGGAFECGRVRWRLSIGDGRTAFSILILDRAGMYVSDVVWWKMEDWTCSLIFFLPSQRHLPIVERHSFVLVIKEGAPMPADPNSYSSCSPSTDSYSNNSGWHCFSPILYDGYNTMFSLLVAILPRFLTNILDQTVASEESRDLQEATPVILAPHRTS